MPVTNSYYAWLVEQVSTRTLGDTKFENLLGSLFRTDFISVVEFDDNRARDGLALRDQFVDETHISIEGTELITAPCTMFELVLGLAKRLDWQLDGYSDNTEADWFWVLLGNVGLFTYTDERWDAYPESYARSYRTIINTLLERRYDETGMGGFFPLRNPERDQRTIEIWAQMNDWCMEQTAM